MPLAVILIGASALAMLAPALVALETADWHSARAFTQSAALVAFLALLLGLVAQGRGGITTRGQLLALPLAYLLLPAVLAVPVVWIRPGAGPGAAYLDMIACFTTTGGSFLPAPATLPPALGFWRALVGWMGGFFVWVSALAILAPLELGGFEVLGRNPAARRRRAAAAGTVGARQGRGHLPALARRLLPIYAGITLALWILLGLVGGSGLPALSAAMSTVATSGILPGGGDVPGGRGGEALVMLFFVFALTRVSYGHDSAPSPRAFLEDRELRTGLVIAAAAAALLFFGHWTAGGGALASVGEMARVLWAMAFTALSFLVTAGFVSADWPAVLLWSGDSFQAIVLMGLVQIGGGVATTAGGVKLLRVYVLWRHGRREMARLVHPSVTQRLGWAGAPLSRRGVYLAWIFFMLFALAIALTTAALSLAGLPFEAAIAHALAALTTTGPLAGIAGGGEGFAALGPAAQALLAAAMILGRLETLALVAMFDPALWRR